MHAIPHAQTYCTVQIMAYMYLHNILVFHLPRASTRRRKRRPKRAYFRRVSAPSLPAADHWVGYYTSMSKSTQYYTHCKRILILWHLHITMYYKSSTIQRTIKRRRRVSTFNIHLAMMQRHIHHLPIHAKIIQSIHHGHSTLYTLKTMGPANRLSPRNGYIRSLAVQLSRYSIYFFRALYKPSSCPQCSGRWGERRPFPYGLTCRGGN
jgi:hypothetical protein